MGARVVARILCAVVLLAADLSQADNNAGRVEPLDGTQSMTSPATKPGIRSERTPRAVPQGDVSPQGTTPFGGSLPPNNLTPAPLLPFNPNRPLMPSPSAPAPSSSSGRIGR